MSEKDNIYSQPLNVSDFQFDESVVEVFPDMIQRSVPGYSTILSTIGKLTKQFAQDNSTLYDLGCSLGAASLMMRRNCDAADCTLIAVDNSQAMVERCQLHLGGFKSATPANVICAGIEDVELTNASVVVLNFTLQFVPVAERQAIINRIYNALLPGGLLVLSEKLKFEATECDTLLVELHHDFKRSNGYSELEISQKRSALENVLVPDTLATHEQRFSEAGFSQFTQWYQCFNFSSMLAIK